MGGHLSTKKAEKVEDAGQATDDALWEENRTRVNGIENRLRCERHRLRTTVGGLGKLLG